MIEQIVVVKNHGGIHARPAGIIVKTAQNYQSDIDFIYNETTINAKNIMALVSININHYDELKIACNGIDEKEATDAFKVLFANRFGEDSRGIY